jgi:hypothetical protein
LQDESAKTTTRRVLSREFTMMKYKFATDHLIGECHINFEKLLSGIISMSTADDS